MVTGGTEIERIWGWLSEVADPELPAISVVDLGIVREIAWQDGVLHVAVTPTYSGCPATAVIAHDIEAALRAHGIANLRLETRLAPAWTSDWLSPRGRERLHAAGIAPPPALVQIAPASAPAATCPHCGSTHTERVSAFGSTPCKALCRCRDCREPFDSFKPI